jgi:hypothetical protein
VGLVGEGRRGTFKVHAGQAVQPHLLDDCAHRGLRIAQPKRAAVGPQPPRQDGEIEHQRGVPEHQVGQVNDHIAPRLDGPGKRAPTETLGGPVLISSTTQYRGGVIELDDPGNLHKSARPRKLRTRVSGL